MKRIAPGVAWHRVSIANVYLVGEPEGAWVLVDAGPPGCFETIRAAAVERFGADTPPAAIVLTHGHGDHAGSARALAEYWDVPVYAHPLEMPFLTGRAAYPPADPTVGGFIAFASRFSGPNGTDLGERVRALPEDGVLPALPEWRWLHVPGHAPGQVALWREEDATLLAADAFTTVDLDSALDLLSKKRKIARPTSPITYDWVRARRSLVQLAELGPFTVACGHGVPMAGPEVAGELQAFAEDFTAPLQGRYVVEPARIDADGAVELPPAPADPLPKWAAGVGVALAVGAVAIMVSRRKKETAEAEP